MAPEEVVAQNDLNDRQKEFCLQYILCHFNGTKAAKAAGYQGNDITLASVAYENLRKTQIRSEIDRILSLSHMSADEIIAMLEEMAHGSLDDFVYPSGRGMRIDIKKAKAAGMLHLVKSYSKGKQGEKIELYSRKDALELLGKAKKLFTDRHEIAGDPSAPVKIVVEYVERNTTDPTETA